MTLNEKLKRLRDFTLYVRNCHELGPHPLRMEGVLMTDLVDKVIEETDALLKEKETNDD